LQIKSRLRKSSNVSRITPTSWYWAATNALLSVKEVAVLASALRMHARKEGKEVKIEEVTLERQCDHEYLDEIRDVIDQYDAVVSLACGVGVQFTAEQYHSTALWAPPKNVACGRNAVRAADNVFWPLPGASARYPAAPNGFLTVPAAAQPMDGVRSTPKWTAPGS
jgi:hypothetical protein